MYVTLGRRICARFAGSRTRDNRRSFFFFSLVFLLKETSRCGTRWAWFWDEPPRTGEGCIVFDVSVSCAVVCAYFYACRAYYPPRLWGESTPEAAFRNRVLGSRHVRSWRAGEALRHELRRPRKLRGFRLRRMSRRLVSAHAQLSASAR